MLPEIIKNMVNRIIEHMLRGAPSPTAVSGRLWRRRKQPWRVGDLPRRTSDRLGVKGIYFGRSLASVPEGALVFFPYLPGRINCGITAVLSFKKDNRLMDHARCVTTFEEKTRALLTHSWEDLEKDGSVDTLSYLGGHEQLAEVRKHSERLKRQDVFWNILSNESCEKGLSTLLETLETGIGKEESILAQKKGEIPAAVYEDIAARMTTIKDIHWALKHEILGNVEKVRSLGNAGRFDSHRLSFVCSKRSIWS
jgi:hypothetical protein